MIGLAGNALGNFLPADLNFSGGFGLAGLLAVIFPYLHKIILHLFDFNVTEYIAKFFDHDTFLGKMFEGNSALGAGVGIVSVGAAFTFLQRLWMQGYSMYCDFFTVSIVIHNSGETYQDFQDMLDWARSRQPKKPKHVNLMSENKQSDTGKWARGHDLIAAEGPHYFLFGGKKFEILMEKGNSDDKMKISTTSAACDTSIFLEILADVKAFKQAKNEGKTVIHTGSGGYWQQSGQPRRKRPLNSVILDENVPEYILADVKDFLDSAEWYTEFGVPYRRGYLLHGPPGTGKTSFISAVAGHFNLNVCILNLSDKSLTDDSLNRLLIDAPENSIILLEDVDAAFVSREASKTTTETRTGELAEKKDDNTTTAYEGANSLTFSGLLNALDGVASAEGRLLFMTTNYVDKLDPALIRPGRVDTKQYIGHASESQVERMYRRFHRNATDEQAKAFTVAVFDQPVRPNISLAQMQGLFLRFKHDPAQAVTGIAMLYETQKILVY